TLNPSCSPASEPATDTASGTLPRSSRSTAYFARRRLLRTCGTSPAASSWKGATTTVPSGTTAVSGASVGSTRTPTGTSPAGTSGVRGGRITRVTVPDVPGYSESRSGRTSVHAASGPTGSSW